uniref:Ovule protein n=1 Tax=Heterorhabditis bacteriophora TaxID=37862 RepID=A0A1I7XTR7_HETBA
MKRPLKMNLRRMIRKRKRALMMSCKLMQISIKTSTKGQRNCDGSIKIKQKIVYLTHSSDDLCPTEGFTVVCFCSINLRPSNNIMRAKGAIINAGIK